MKHPNIKLNQSLQLREAFKSGSQVDLPRPLYTDLCLWSVICDLP